MVDAFSFAVSLGVVCGGEGEFITKEFSKFFGECRGELWSSVGDDFVIKTKSFEDFLREKSSYSRGVDGFLGGAANYPLSKAMVDHDQ